MASIVTVVPEKARGIRRLFFRWVRRQYGGIVPGVYQILAVDLSSPWTYVSRAPQARYIDTFTFAARPLSAGSSVRCWLRS